MLPKPTITRRPEKTVCLMSGMSGYFQRERAGAAVYGAAATRYVKPGVSAPVDRPRDREAAIFSPPLGIAISGLRDSASVPAGFGEDPREMHVCAGMRKSVLALALIAFACPRWR